MAQSELGKHTSATFITRGILAIIFGILVLAWPGIALFTLIAFFAAFAFIDGIVSLFGAFSSRHRDDAPLMLLLGLVGILVGLLTFFRPGLTAMLLLFLIALRAIAGGVLEIGVAIRTRHIMSGSWLLAISGIVGIAFGILVLAYPFAGALAVLWLIGIYAIVYGLLQVALVFQVHHVTKYHEAPPGTVQPG